MRYLYISLFLSVFALNANAQIITTVAGNGFGGTTTGAYLGDGGQATAAEFYYPNGVAIDASGNIFISDCYNNRIRRINTLGIITTSAGNGTLGYSGDGGQATNAMLNKPDGIALDASGNLYIADWGNCVIRKVTTSGIITTVAGNGVYAFSGDGGSATNASFRNVQGVTVDLVGNIYISDEFSYRIRKVNTAGIISTIAGGGSSGLGDGGLATNAEIGSAAFLATDMLGNLYITDDFNRIRKVDTSGIITTFAGNGTAGYSGDGGQATAAELNGSAGICVYGVTGDVFIGDNSNNCVRKVNSNGVISTFAGNGTAGYSGDGALAANAELNYPWGVALDYSGNMYIADEHNQRIRMVTNAEAAGIAQFASSNEQINIYPNPATNSLQVSFAGNIENSTLVITDMMGNTVKQLAVSSKQVSINVSDLNEGVYTISISHTTGVINKRVVIVR